MKLYILYDSDEYNAAEAVCTLSRDLMGIREWLEDVGHDEEYIKTVILNEDDWLYWVKYEI